MGFMLLSNNSSITLLVNLNFSPECIECNIPEKGRIRLTSYTKALVAIMDNQKKKLKSKHMWIFIGFAIYQNKRNGNYCKHHPGQNSHESNGLLSEAKLLFMH